MITYIYIIDKNLKKIIFKISFNKDNISKFDINKIFPPFQAKSQSYLFSDKNISDFERYKVNASDELELKSDLDLINEGLISLPINKKIVNNQLVDKSDIEMYLEGTKQIPISKKIENNELVDKSPKEQYDEGLISLNDYRIIKFKKLRDVRDYILNNTMWIAQRHSLEKQGMELGYLVTTTLSSGEYLSWLQYWETLRNLPQNINIDLYNLEDFFVVNTEIFGEFPTQNELTPIPF
jgi:hypothetical protein